LNNLVSLGAVIAAKTNCSMVSIAAACRIKINDMRKIVGKDDVKRVGVVLKNLTGYEREILLYYAVHQGKIRVFDLLWPSTKHTQKKIDDCISLCSRHKRWNILKKLMKYAVSPEVIKTVKRKCIDMVPLLKVATKTAAASVV
jgi:hypothetical protein